jgi:hypothetical protein
MNAPSIFWANNDFDRWDHSVLDGWVEDDVQSNSIAAESPYINPDDSTPISVPDFNYTNVYGNRAIPCPRDLYMRQSSLFKLVDNSGAFLGRSGPAASSQNKMTGGAM